MSSFYCKQVGKEVDGVEKDFDAMVVGLVGKGHDDGVRTRNPG